MNHRVLIVSPHFPPINAADHQRIRMALPYFEEFGWDVTVLCIEPDFIEGIYDPNLNLTVPDNIEIIRSSAISPKLSRKLKLGNLGFRSIPFLIKATAKYFEKNYFDLVYFSNTVFLTMPLGRYWLEKYKVPYILDFQDPWLSDYYDRTQNTPPGGKLKYAVVQSFAKILEPFTLAKARHITSVSPEYPKVLMQRYSWLKEEQFSVLPFGAPEKDFEILPKLNSQQKIFDPHDGYQHWVYVGRCFEAMYFSLKSLFATIQKHRQHNPEIWQKIKIHFVGTKYSIFDNNKEIEAMAKSYNLEDIITEYPQRIPYFEALQVLKDSHAILIIGSDDPGYSASKVYPCILAQKPILAILHEQSFVVNLLESCQAGQVVSFRDTATTNLVDPLIDKIDWLLSQSQNYTPATDWQAFKPYTAKEMTRHICHIFDLNVN
ncbi:glycosyltransferase family protein [Dolichospermum flos-aquae]|uniref:Uncharacterized protein n=1 Tax=Dolichospermum flos-aquae LEGE 04289 TaxID=1828708 RepID=A0ACC5Q2B9_DOLFA|nr:hypothetical protein [Dolichospermum flos-aquae]MBE9219646.1 hypothetical protein [Dolichospermum flos-aquae LEGE 04289]